MVQEFGVRQQTLLRLLLENKAGMTVDALVKALGITRTAVNQHLSSLEGRGYVKKASLTQTGGRPGYAYVLTMTGIELFPKQYSWFSELLLESLKAQLGQAGLAEFLVSLGGKLSEEHRERFSALSPDARVAEVISLMNTLGYETTGDGSSEKPVIRAQNCVYHNLAKTYHEVCEFDISLISRLLDSDVKHEQCMARGDACCEFIVQWKKNN